MRLNVRVFYRGAKKQSTVDVQDKLDYLSEVIKAHLAGSRLHAEGPALERSIVTNDFVMWFGKYKFS